MWQGWQKIKEARKHGACCAGPVSCGAKHRGNSSEEGAWALTTGHSHTTEDSVSLFCGAKYRADMPITHHGGGPGGMKAAPGLPV